MGRSGKIGRGSYSIRVRRKLELHRDRLLKEKRHVSKREERDKNRYFYRRWRSVVRGGVRGVVRGGVGREMI